MADSFSAARLRELAEAAVKHAPVLSPIRAEYWAYCELHAATLLALVERAAKARDDALEEGAHELETMEPLDAGEREIVMDCCFILRALKGKP